MPGGFLFEIGIENSEAVFVSPADVGDEYQRAVPSGCRTNVGATSVGKS